MRRWLIPLSASLMLAVMLIAILATPHQVPLQPIALSVTVAPPSRELLGAAYCPYFLNGNGGLVGAAIEEVAQQALSYLPYVERISGSPEVRLARQVTSADLEALGLDAINSQCYPASPLALVILRGQFIYSGPGFRSPNFMSNPPDEYVGYIYNLCAGRVTAVMMSHYGGRFRTALNDPRLPDDVPIMPSATPMPGAIPAPPSPFPLPPYYLPCGALAPSIVFLPGQFALTPSRPGLLSETEAMRLAVEAAGAARLQGAPSQMVAYCLALHEVEAFLEESYRLLLNQALAATERVQVTPYPGGTSATRAVWLVLLKGVVATELPPSGDDYVWSLQDRTLQVALDASTGQPMWVAAYPPYVWPSASRPGQPLNPVMVTAVPAPTRVVTTPRSPLNRGLGYPSAPTTDVYPAPTPRP